MTTGEPGESPPAAPSAEVDHSATLPPEDDVHGTASHRERLESGVQHLLEAERRGAERVRRSGSGRTWSRLNAVDFMNSSIQFAALALLCLFPFLMIIAAELGGDARPALIRRLGLDRGAAHDLNSLMSQGRHAAATLDILGGALVLLGAIGIASTLQAWYQRVYDVPAHSRWTRRMTAQLLWLAGFVAYLFVQDLLNRLADPFGGRFAVFVIFFITAAAFYWWTQHVLLLGTVPWRRLVPGAVATGLCLTGLGVFSELIFSGQIVSGYRNYGSIGVVMVLLSYLIGFGVCLHLGAAVGQVWNERVEASAATPE